MDRSTVAGMYPTFHSLNYHTPTGWRRIESIWIVLVIGRVPNITAISNLQHRLSSVHVVPGKGELSMCRVEASRESSVSTATHHVKPFSASKPHHHPSHLRPPSIHNRSLATHDNCHTPLASRTNGTKMVGCSSASELLSERLPHPISPQQPSPASFIRHHHHHHHHAVKEMCSRPSHRRSFCLCFSPVIEPRSGITVSHLAST